MVPIFLSFDQAGIIFYIGTPVLLRIQHRFSFYLISRSAIIHRIQLGFQISNVYGLQFNNSRPVRECFSGDADCAGSSASTDNLTFGRFFFNLHCTQFGIVPFLFEGDGALLSAACWFKTGCRKCGGIRTIEQIRVMCNATLLLRWLSFRFNVGTGREFYLACTLPTCFQINAVMNNIHASESVPLMTT